MRRIFFITWVLAVSGLLNLSALIASELPARWSRNLDFDRKKLSKAAADNWAAGLESITYRDWAACVQAFKNIQTQKRVFKLAYAQVNEAYCHSETGNLEQSLAALKKALVTDPTLKKSLEPIQTTLQEKIKNTQARLADANRHLENKNYKACVTSANEALGFNGRSATAYNSLGQCQFLLGDEKTALASLTQALFFDPQLGAASGNRARVHAELRKCPEARRDFEAALKANPKIKESRAEYLKKCG